MVEMGKKFFTDSATQTFTILLCFGLAIIAKYFSMVTASMSLSDFIATFFDNIFTENDGYSIWLNIILPSIFYFLSSLLLLWMAVSNFITLRKENSKLDIGLKTLLGIIEIVLFGLFLYIGGKLLFELVILGCMILFLVWLFAYGFSSESRNY